MFATTDSMDDCDTCGVGEPLQLNTPEIAEISMTVTDKAKEILVGVLAEEENSVLLVGLLSGGCSGYLYDLQIVEKPSDSKFQGIEVGQIPIYVDRATSQLLDGIEIDYVDKLMGGGFKISNPNANRNCGCGESFG